MDSLKIVMPGPTRLASVPLLVVYGVMPLSTAIVHAMGGIMNTVSTMLPWLLLAGLGVLWSLRGSSRSEDWKRLGFGVALLLSLVVGILLYAGDIRTALLPYQPYLNELTPLAFLLFSLLWVSTCGLPDRADFQRFGALLGTVCILDLVAEYTMYGLVPTVRWIGNADILSGLLLVSLCAGLRPGANEGGCFEPDQGLPLWRWLIMAGVLACLSRTGLFAAAWVVLCFGRGRFGLRFIYGLACFVLLLMTFFLPPTSTDAIRYVGYWLWVEGIGLFVRDPHLLLTGVPLAAPLPVDFPPTMQIIWQVATGQSAQLGAHVGQIPSFWLRLGMGWGALVPVGLLVTIFTLLLRRLTRMGAGLTAVLFAQGMATPLFFDSGTCVALCFGFLLALSSASTPMADTVGMVPDSVTEWDLRPR